MPYILSNKIWANVGVLIYYGSNSGLALLLLMEGFKIQNPGILFEHNFLCTRMNRTFNLEEKFNHGSYSAYVPK